MEIYHTAGRVFLDQRLPHELILQDCQLACRSVTGERCDLIMNAVIDVALQLKHWGGIAPRIVAIEHLSFFERFEAELAP